jgi:hypothetical protein
MEQVIEISPVEPEHPSFDAVEIAGLIVPLLFAVMTIVLVAMNPDPGATATEESKAPIERLEQIQRR